jgi:hypothetical protein
MYMVVAALGVARDWCVPDVLLRGSAATGATKFRLDVWLRLWMSHLAGTVPEHLLECSQHFVAPDF